MGRQVLLDGIKLPLKEHVYNLWSSFVNESSRSPRATESLYAILDDMQVTAIPGQRLLSYCYPCSGSLLFGTWNMLDIENALEDDLEITTSVKMWLSALSIDPERGSHWLPSCFQSRPDFQSSHFEGHLEEMYRMLGSDMGGGLHIGGA